jgi:thiol-disulfide isomerase/thioredoxin
MNRRQWIMIGGISLLAAAAGALTSQWLSKTNSVSEAGVKAFFNNAWLNPEGKAISTQDWQGKLLVVNFWASWCPPCVEEMPELQKLQGEFSQQNVLFVGIAIDSPSNVREFLKKTPVSYPIAMGGMDGSQIYKALGNSQSALPYTVVINPSGMAIYQKLGKIDEEELRKAIKAAL